MILASSKNWKGPNLADAAAVCHMTDAICLTCGYCWVKNIRIYFFQMLHARCRMPGDRRFGNVAWGPRYTCPCPCSHVRLPVSMYGHLSMFKQPCWVTCFCVWNQPLTCMGKLHLSLSVYPCLSIGLRIRMGRPHVLSNYTDARNIPMTLCVNNIVYNFAE